MSETALHKVFGPFFYQGQLVTAPKLYHYIPGSTQEKTAWSDYNKNLTAENPIVGDANGLVSGYFDGLYKIEVRTHDGTVVLGQWDNARYDPSTQFDVFGSRVLFASDYGSINLAVDAAGNSLPTTIIVTEPTTITSTFTLASSPNIHWTFLGSGRLVPSGVAITLYSPETIDADPAQHCLDASNGTIHFAKPGKIYANWFGAKNDGVTPSVAFVQDAIDALPQNLAEVEGGEVAMLGGDYLWDDSFVLDQDRFIFSGVGMGSTRILCTMVGKPAIKFTGERVFVHLRDFWLEGNGLTGGSGNGHGISMLDPTPDTGAFAPQLCIVERVQVVGFRGNDSDGRGGTMMAAAIAQVSTLENTVTMCRLDSCGYGLHIDTCYTPRVLNNMLIDNDKYGIQALGAQGVIENIFFRGNDTLNNGDGTTVSQTGYSSAPTGNAYFYNLVGFDISGNKFKNANLANVVLAFCKGGAMGGNFVRADSKYGAIIRCCRGIEIQGGMFDCTNGSANNPEYLTIQSVNGKDSSGINVHGVHFRFQSGITITHCIRIEGDTNARKLKASSIRNCVFGDTDLASSCIVTNVITVVNITLEATQIAFNDFYAETNVTISCGFRTDTDTVFGSGFDWFKNTFHVASGTITAQKTIAAGGFAEELDGSGTPEGNVTAYRSARYKRLDGGAGTCMYIKESSGWGNTGWVAK